MALKKSDLVKEISEQLNLSQTDAKHYIETLMEAIISTLASGEDVMISEFGKFLVKDKAPRWGRNPATGERMILAKRRVVVFKCSKKHRKLIWQHYLDEKKELNRSWPA